MTLTIEGTRRTVLIHTHISDPLILLTVFPHPFHCLPSSSILPSLILLTICSHPNRLPSSTLLPSFILWLFPPSSSFPDFTHSPYSFHHSLSPQYIILILIITTLMLILFSFIRSSSSRIPYLPSRMTHVCKQVPMMWVFLRMFPWYVLSRVQIWCDCGVSNCIFFSWKLVTGIIIFFSELIYINCVRGGEEVR